MDNRCPICQGPMQRVIDLPRYPLTEMYEPYTPDFNDRGYIDQALLLCEACSHAKLETIVPKEQLYGVNYRTKTAKSIGATDSVNNFARFIKSFDLKSIDDFIDIGGNDGTLVNQFEGRRVIVDPNAPEGHIQSYIEDADLSEFKRTKLVMSSHTLEHLENPETLLGKVSNILFHCDLFAIQFPSLELLVEDARIDQINHQHIHYYSQRSITSLLAKFGIEVIRAEFDHDHYGSLMLMCQKGKGKIEGEKVSRFLVSIAETAFNASVEGARCFGAHVAFGAAFTLPVWKYHMPELNYIEYIADDDTTKNGLRYINFNKEIRNDYNLEGRDVIITGASTKMTCRKLVTKAFNLKAMNVIVPLHIL